MGLTPAVGKTRANQNGFAVPPVLSVDSGDQTDQTESFPSVTRTSLTNLLGGLTSQAVRLLVVIFVARRFAAAEFGAFSFAWAVNAFMYVVSHFGLPTYGTRQVAVQGTVTYRFLRNIGLSRVGLGLAAMVATLVVLCAIPQINRQDLYLVGLFGLSNVIQAGFVDWAFQGLGRIDVSAILNCVFQIVWLGLVVVSVHRGAGILAVGVTLCISALLTQVLGVLWLTNRIQFDGSFSAPVSAVLHDCCGLLKSGAALGFGTVLVTVLVWSDAIIVRLLRGDTTVGIYAAAERPALALGLLLNFYLQGAFPTLSHARKQGIALFQESFQRLYNNVALIFLPGCIWSAFYAREILRLLFGGPQYLQGAMVFRIFQLLMPLIVFTYVFGNCVLLPFHRDSEYQRTFLIVGVLFIPLCVALTMKWDITGAAATSVVCYLIASAMFHIVSRELITADHVQALLLPCLAGVTVGLLGRWLHISLIPAFMFLLLANAGLLVKGHASELHGKVVALSIRPESVAIKRGGK